MRVLLIGVCALLLAIVLQARPVEPAAAQTAAAVRTLTPAPPNTAIAMEMVDAGAFTPPGGGNVATFSRAAPPSAVAATLKPSATRHQD
jgi:hypothetical protein